MVDLRAVLTRLPGRGEVLAAVDRLPLAREVARPFVPGDPVEAAVSAVAEVMAEGMSASVAYLAPPDALATSRLVHLRAIQALADAELAEGNDLTVTLAALGLGQESADSVRGDVGAVCGAAAAAGMTVTLAATPHALVAATLALRAALAGEFPDLGVTLAANLHRTEGDCLDLGAAGARVRLVRRESAETAEVAFTDAHDIDRAYVRCLRLLMDSEARTVVLTHDPRLVQIAIALAERAEGDPGRHSFQFRQGQITEQAAELVAAGATVSILVPFGPAWADYVSRRIAVTPGALGRAARALGTRGGDR